MLSNKFITHVFMATLVLSLSACKGTIEQADASDEITQTDGNHDDLDNGTDDGGQSEESLPVDDTITTDDDGGCDCSSTESCINGQCFANGYNILYQNDFQHRELGKYQTREDFNIDWNIAWNWPVNRWDEFEVVTDPISASGKVGKFTFPFYDAPTAPWSCWCSPDCLDGEHLALFDFDDEPTFCASRWQYNGVGPSDGGAQWFVDLEDSYDEVYLSYRIKFSNNFSGVGGGKLFGFYPAENACPGCSSTDCDNDGDADDFTGKMMFSGHIDSGSYFYIYHFDKDEDCGDTEEINDDNVFTDWGWHTITLRVQMNTVDQYNGNMEAWIDGQSAGSVSGLRFRVGDASLGIATMGVTTFFGGDRSTRCDTQDGGDCGHEIPWSSQHYACAKNPDDPCSDLYRYSDNSVYYFYAPRKTEYLYVDDIVVFTYE